MHLKTLRLRNFRNYSDTTITFSPGMNVFLGDNAQGKTNLLEAIHLLSTGRSFRTPYLHELIQWGKKSFYIEAEIQKEYFSEKLQLHFDGRQKKFHYNTSTHFSFSHLLGVLPSVLYSPSDIFLISGQPMNRRRFLNLHLAQKDPMYVYHFTRFTRALKQRNILLKKKERKSIEFFEEEMVSSAVYLVTSRNRLITDLSEKVQPFIQELLKDASLSMQYHSFLPLSLSEKDLKKMYYEQLQKNQKKEQELGTTLTGPHRDDFSIYIQSYPGKSFASEGQKRCATAALKFAECKLLSEFLNSTALLSIDDFGIHLDTSKKTSLKSLLKHFSQVFITAPKGETFSEEQIFMIEEAKVHTDRPSKYSAKS